jgi:hypothetical protein
MGLSDPRCAASPGRAVTRRPARAPAYRPAAATCSAQSGWTAGGRRQERTGDGGVARAARGMRGARGRCRRGSRRRRARALEGSAGRSAGPAATWRGPPVDACAGPRGRDPVSPPGAPRDSGPAVGAISPGAPGAPARTRPGRRAAITAIRDRRPATVAGPARREQCRRAAVGEGRGPPRRGPRTDPGAHQAGVVRCASPVGARADPRPMSSRRRRERASPRDVARARWVMSTPPSAGR